MTSWMPLARAKIGVREVPGPGNSPVIMRWAKGLGSKVLGMVYGADSVPWCGLFVAEVMTEAGFKPPPISVRAKAWATWGTATSAKEGAVLVFEREGGGHVGFYVAENATAYQVLGGNQGDAVSITWIAKARCVAVRWPPGVPDVGHRVVVSAVGELSRNEA